METPYIGLFVVLKIYSYSYNSLLYEITEICNLDSGLTLKCDRRYVYMKNTLNMEKIILQHVDDIGDMFSMSYNKERINTKNPQFDLQKNREIIDLEIPDNIFISVNKDVHFIYDFPREYELNIGNLYIDNVCSTDRFQIKFNYITDWDSYKFLSSC